jgi:hypothetical protein
MAGFLGRLFGGKPQSQTAAAMTVHAGALVAVVGESHRQDVLRRLAQRTTGSAEFLDELHGRARKVGDEKHDGRWFRAALIREPSNEWDSNAIGVWADGVGLVGYLDRDDAIDYQIIFEALNRHGCAVASCPAFLIGGEPHKPSYGVMLCLSSPELICSELAATAVS